MENQRHRKQENTTALGCIDAQMNDNIPMNHTLMKSKPWIYVTITYSINETEAGFIYRRWPFGLGLGLRIWGLGGRVVAWGSEFRV